MLTFFHAPQSRSTLVLALLHELDALDRVDLRVVGIRRQDGTGRHDPANPHPEGKVPLLCDGDTLIRETPAIMMHLCDLFPEAGMGVPPGGRDRGTWLSWMVWYGSVLEPLMILNAAGLSHPYFDASLRGLPEAFAHLRRGLDGRLFLMGDRYTSVDLLVASPFMWFQDATPDDPVIREWVARCAVRDGVRMANSFDTEAIAA